jgi:glycosyltransferase involved in cell wall biosynthesis
MRIGIGPILSGLTGGIYQYSLTMIHALGMCKGNMCGDEFIVFASRMDHPAIVDLNRERWMVRPWRPPSLMWGLLKVLSQLAGETAYWEIIERLKLEWRSRARLADLDVVRPAPNMTRWLNHFGVDLMVYPAPIALSFEAGIPYVMAIHDLQHRLQPEFPEVSAYGEWERREYMFRNGARYATILLTDSDVGREDVLDFYGPYGLTPDRVKVLPFLPASYLGIEVSDNEQLRMHVSKSLPPRYLFYPAQFWPHKNHVRIVKALWLLKQEYHVKLAVVFCGSNAGTLRRQTFNEVISLSRRLHVDDQISYLGYVSDDCMAGLYSGATAVIMPTFFGPTNIPVLEGWALGCPVITSDIRGIREQVGDAAILVDPRSVESIANGIYRLCSDENLRRTLVERGRGRLATYGPDDFRYRVIEILKEAKDRVRSEKLMRGKE